VICKIGGLILFLPPMKCYKKEYTQNLIGRSSCLAHLLAVLLGNTYSTWWFVFVRPFLRGVSNFCVQLAINIEGICVHTTASCCSSEGLEIKQSQFSI